MQERCNICKYIHVIHHIHGPEDKHHVIILLDAEKALGKVKYTFMIKVLE